MTLHRKKPKMARAAWRVCGCWVFDISRLRAEAFLKPFHDVIRWHKAVKP